MCVLASLTVLRACAAPRVVGRHTRWVRKTRECIVHGLDVWAVIHNLFKVRPACRGTPPRTTPACNIIKGALLSKQCHRGSV